MKQNSVITCLQSRYIKRILHPKNPHLLVREDEACRSTSDLPEDSWSALGQSHN